MRKMFSEKQILKMVDDEAVKGIKGKDINVEGITSKGIANTGEIANIGGITATGDIKGKTLEQSEANWSVDLSEVVPSVSGTFEATNIFSRVQKINAELEIIFTFSITNTGDTSATPANVQLGAFDVPENIGSKIIDVNGDPLTTSATLVAIAGARMVNTPYPPAQSVVFSAQYGTLAISHQATKLFIGAYGLQAISAGATHTYSGRIQLTLI